MNRLLDIGFETAGHWQLSGDDLTFELLRYGSQHNILYAFACDGEIKYVGKTIQPLRKRMAGYRNPGTSQSTNIKNHNHIKNLLKAGAGIDILALPDSGLMHYGQFHLNLAAGLEDNIIDVIQPEWNGKQAKAASDRGGEPAAVYTFPLVLQKTYYNSGFFNHEQVEQIVMLGDVFELDERIQETCELLNDRVQFGDNPGPARFSPPIRFNCRKTAFRRKRCLSR